MTRHDRELSQLLSAIANQAGARLIAIQQTGSGHRKAVFIKGAIVADSSSPVRHRAIVAIGRIPRRWPQAGAAVTQRV
jgi:hypothetical protein